MKKIFYRLTKSNCQILESAMREDGLLELGVPQSSSTHDIRKYMSSLDEGLLLMIAKKQRKHNLAFREQVQDRINKYVMDFNLPITRIYPRFSMRTKKMFDYNIAFYGWMVEGCLTIPAFLEYCPFEMVDEVIRCGVACLAIEYEQNMLNIKECKPVAEKIPGSDDIHIRYISVTDDEKYQVPFDEKEFDVMIEQYFKVAPQIAYLNKHNPILMAKVNISSITNNVEVLV